MASHCTIATLSPQPSRLNQHWAMKPRKVSWPQIVRSKSTDLEKQSKYKATYYCNPSLSLLRENPPNWCLNPMKRDNLSLRLLSKRTLNQSLMAFRNHASWQRAPKKQNIRNRIQLTLHKASLWIVYLPEQDHRLPDRCPGSWNRVSLYFVLTGFDLASTMLCFDYTTLNYTFTLPHCSQGTLRLNTTDTHWRES